jgi:predicted ABC-type ATPase
VVERAALSPTAKGKGEKIGSEGKIASEHIESDLRYHCQRSPMSPSIYTIAGPNGVGKTSVDLALSRIKGRVSEGGHDVPEADVRRRFDRSIKNFLVWYRALADSWFLFDNSLGTPSVIALEEQGRRRIMKADAYDTLVAQYGNPD